MSKGDCLFGIETTYKGIKMRSKFETKIAYFLDGLEIKWEYEPQIFLLSNGDYYKPDFCLPELKMWIEVKGVIEEHNKEISRTFVQDNNTELWLLSETESMWFSMKDFVDGMCEDNNIRVGKCHTCHSFFFCSNHGLYHCRNCGGYNGDHDLILCFEEDDYPCDFSDLQDIKNLIGELKKRGERW
jgi:hypothetical protein